ncbi:MAG: hypothetical protein V9F03_14845 [Microthrixaceae bacterium]
MSYRADFWINVVIGFVAQYGVMFSLWQALYRESGQSTIRGWTFPMMILYYVLATHLHEGQTVGCQREDAYSGRR